MATTVIAVFDDVGRAQHAYEALKVAGFGNDRIEVHSGEEFVQRGRAAAEPERPGLRGALKRFLDELGVTTPEPPPDAATYHPLAPGDRIIVLETSDDRADRAAAILDHEGAVNVEERVQSAGAPGTGAAKAGGARIYPPTDD